MALGTREAAFWQKIRKGLGLLKPLGRPILLNRIESPGTGRGVPDVFLADPEYGACWIELKVFQYQKVNISPLQANWLRQHASCGVRTRIVALILRDRQLIRVWNGIGAEAVRQRGLRVSGAAPDIDLDTREETWRNFRLALFFDRNVAQ